MNRPDYIGVADWNELLTKYHGNLPLEIIEKLEQKYPIQYLIGYVEFLDTKITVNESVLIPRFETELLVKKVIEINKENKLRDNSVIDLGCGSGAIAISLAKEFNISVDALDISKESLKVAAENAKNNNVKINLINQDILKDKINLNHTLIISNPPYVDYNEDVDPQTKYEPQNAIFAPENGLAFYNRIIELAKLNKQKKFLLAFEIGCTQKEAITKKILECWPSAKVICEKDFSGRDRYIFANINE